MKVTVRCFETPGDHAAEVLDHVKPIIDERGITSITPE